MSATRFFAFVVLLPIGCASVGTRADFATLATMHETASEAYTRGEWAAAVSAYTRLLAKAPDDAEAWLRLGNAYSRLGQADDAISSYRRAITIDHANAKAWFNLGVVLLGDARQAFAEAGHSAGSDEALRVAGESLAERLAQVASARPADAGDGETSGTKTPEGDEQ